MTAVHPPLLDTMTIIDTNPEDADPFRWAWGIVAVVLLGLLGIGAVGLDMAYRKATVRPTDDAPAERQKHSINSQLGEEWGNETHPRSRFYRAGDGAGVIVES